MIDTENKRRSVIASGLDALTIRPVADSDMSVFDRRHRAAHYSGLETTFDNFFFWRKNAAAGGEFAQVGSADEDFSQSRPAGGDWVQVQEVRDDSE